MNEESYTHEERELMVAMFEQGKAERAYLGAKDELEHAQKRARDAYRDYLAVRGITQ